MTAATDAGSGTQIGAPDLPPGRSSSSPSRNAIGVGLTAVVTLAGTAGLFWWWATGVRGKEDCSAMVGSMELPGPVGDVPRMYSPCDLIGYMDALVGVSILGAVVMVLVPTRRARLVVAVVIVAFTLVIATIGSTFLRV